MEVIDLGQIDYLEARSVQNSLVRLRQSREISDRVIFCEHPEVITLGRRMVVGFAEEIIPGVPQYRVDRGGLAAYHAPGQLIIYPVVSLVDRHMGVRDFISWGLLILADALRQLSYEIRVSIAPAGLWVKHSSKEGYAESKIGFVGLRIERGVTNHGFAINVCCNLEKYQYFEPCGLSSVRIGSLQEFSSTVELTVKSVGDVLREVFAAL